MLCEENISFLIQSIVMFVTLILLLMPEPSVETFRMRKHIIMQGGYHTGCLCLYICKDVEASMAGVFD